MDERLTATSELRKTMPKTKTNAKAQTRLTAAQRKIEEEYRTLAPMVLNTSLEKLADVLIEMVVNVLAKKNHEVARANYRQLITCMLLDTEPLDTVERMLALKIILLYCVSLDRWEHACDSDSPEPARAASLKQAIQVDRLQAHLVEQLGRHRARPYKPTAFRRVTMEGREYMIVTDAKAPQPFSADVFARKPDTPDPRTQMHKQRSEAASTDNAVDKGS
jgi:hypothetical protein